MKKAILIFGIILLVLVAGFFVFNNYIYNQKQAKVPDEGPFIMTGEISCLPKKGNGPQTMECAFGLLGDDGFYYALRNFADDQPISEAIDGAKNLKISGNFSNERLKGPDGNSYDIAGVIDVQSVEKIE